MTERLRDLAATLCAGEALAEPCFDEILSRVADEETGAVAAAAAAKEIKNAVPSSLRIIDTFVPGKPTAARV